MRTLTLVLGIVLSFAATSLAQKSNVVICYYGSWAGYRKGNGQASVESIDPKLCTHMIYSFVGVNDDGTVRVMDAWNDLPDNGGKDGFGKFNKLRERSRGTKTLVAIGGWSEGSTKFSKVVSNPSLRSKFVKNIVAFVRKHKFDGFDVDWEYPAQRGGASSDKRNYVTLLKELRKELNKHKLLLTVAVGAGEAIAAKSYDIPEISKHVHYINIMTYDFNSGANSVTAMNAPLFASKKDHGDKAKMNVNAAVEYWLKKGAPGSKLVLGVPFYGRGFTLADPKKHGVGAKATGPSAAGPYTAEAGLLGYNEICEMLKKGGWTVAHDKEQHVPYAFKGNQWIGYDDVASIREKAEYAKKMGLAGAMVWSIDTDDVHGACGGKYPLLKALNKALR